MANLNTFDNTDVASMEEFINKPKIIREQILDEYKNAPRFKIF